MTDNSNPLEKLLTKHSEAQKPATKEELLEHLQTALALEQATLPPYLTALYSIKEGHNEEAASVIQSVAMEEMLHMLQVANLMLSLGGTPTIDAKGFVPPYPTYLPNSDHHFLVSLEKFSLQAMETFMKIELPGEPGAEPQIDDYTTIGQFYAAIESGLEELCAAEGEGKVFSGNPDLQLPPDYYYGGGGELFCVTSMETAAAAIDMVVDQGEGMDHQVLDGDAIKFGDQEMPAHYFRFEEIYLGRRYTPEDTPSSGPTGDEMEIDWGAVYDMRPSPTKWQYLRHDRERFDKSDEFDKIYTELLARIQRAVTGEGDQKARHESLLGAVGTMYELKYKAQELMRIPVSDDPKALMMGPGWEWVPHEFRRTAPSDEALEERMVTMTQLRLQNPSAGEDIEGS